MNAPQKIVSSLAFALLAACSTSSNPEGSVYPEPRELWDDIDRESLRKERKSSDGFLSPVGCAKSFMKEVFSSAYERNFLSDNRFCSKYFSEALKFQLKTSELQYERRVEGIDPPGSKHFGESNHKKSLFNVWDIPTSFKIGGFHTTIIQGDDDTDEITVSPRAVVDVIYIWGSKTQYAGHQRNTSVILVKESGRWFIQDLYTHEGLFESANSFYESLVVNHNP